MAGGLRSSGNGAGLIATAAGIWRRGWDSKRAATALFLSQFLRIMPTDPTSGPNSRRKPRMRLTR